MVEWTQKDPVGMTETGTDVMYKSVYDPLGNYVPYQPESAPGGPPPGSDGR